MDVSIVAWVNIGIILATLLVGYLFGSIPTALIIGKLFFKKDVRNYGSHNMGATNSGRVFGRKIAVLVTLLDALKLMIPLFGFWAILHFTPIGDPSSGSPIFTLPYQLSIHSTCEALLPQCGWGPTSAVQFYYLAAIGCSIGHCFPIFAGLKGGKSFACFAAFILCSNWVFSIVSLALYALILFPKKYISLASICVAFIMACLSWLTMIPAFGRISTYGVLQMGFEYALTVTIIAIIVIIRHRSNIVRLRNGTEAKAFQKTKNKTENTKDHS